MSTVKIEYSNGKGRGGKQFAYIRPAKKCSNKSRRVPVEGIDSAIARHFPCVNYYKIDGHVIGAKNEDFALKEYWRICEKAKINKVFDCILMPKHEFKHTLFPVSTDYERLWDFINAGHRIPAWIVYSDEYEEIIWDLVEVKFRYNQYSIGTRGIGYEGFEHGLKGFLMVCEQYSLHFIAK